MSLIQWMNTDNDQFPPVGKYVLARHNRGTWRDETDQKNVNCVVVKLVRGISLMEREQMKNGEIPCLEDRWRFYPPEDEHGNNLVPYCWQMFGSDTFDGQTIKGWTPIPDS